MRAAPRPVAGGGVSGGGGGGGGGGSGDHQSGARGRPTHTSSARESPAESGRIPARDGGRRAESGRKWAAVGEWQWTPAGPV